MFACDPAMPATPRWKLLVVAIVLGLLCCIANHALYGGKPLLSGDQSSQIVAAEALAAGEGLLTPSLKAQPIGDYLPGRDYRQTLCWFPPGYSVLIAALGLIGVCAANAALLLFYANAVLSCGLWLLVARKYHIPTWHLLVVFAFQVISYLPCTTTDQFLWPVTAAMFLLFPANSVRSLAGMTVVFCLAVSMRWFAVVLPVIWATWSYFFAGPNGLRSGKNHFRALAPLGIVSVFYLVLVHFLAGSFSPYATGTGTPIYWLLTFKALYFAILGSVSSTWKPMQTVTAALAVFAWAALLASWKAYFVNQPLPPVSEARKVLPRWGAMVLIFQAVTFCFLVAVQLFKGSMYDPQVPAFATARFYYLCQPLSIAFVLWIFSNLAPARFGMRRLLPLLAAAVVLANAGSYWMSNKRALADELAFNERGFLFPKEYVQLESELKRIRPDLVIQSGCDPQVLTVFDPKKLLPTGIERIACDRPLKLARVSNGRVVSVDAAPPVR